MLGMSPKGAFSWGGGGVYAGGVVEGGTAGACAKATHAILNQTPKATDQIEVPRITGIAFLSQKRDRAGIERMTDAPIPLQMGGSRRILNDHRPIRAR